MQKLYENIGGWFTCAVYGGGARRQCQPVESVACASPPSSGRERSTVRSRGRSSNRSIRAGRAGSSHRAGNCRAASCPCSDQFIIVRSAPPMNESLCRLAVTDEWQEQHGCRLIEWRRRTSAQFEGGPSAPTCRPLLGYRTMGSRTWRRAESSAAQAEGHWQSRELTRAPPSQQQEETM